MIELARPSGRWSVHDAGEKLALRGRLPGAFGWDLAAHSIRVARVRRMDLAQLLPLCLPASWMVNSRAPSPVFRRWLTAPLADAWRVLYARLGCGVGAWLGVEAEVRDEVTAAARELSIEGQGVCALSKALALLCPETVPLMDDGALWLLTERRPRPTSADDPQGTADDLCPALDAFARGVLSNEDALVEIARDYETAVLDAPQVLDRLLWFDSWGWRHFTGGERPFREVALGDRRAVMRVDSPPSSTPATEALVVGEAPTGAWEEAVRAALG